MVRFRSFAPIFFILVFAFGACTKKKSPEANVPNQKVLRFSTIAKLKGMDPVQTSDLYSSTEVNRVYENLFQYNYLKRPYELELLLAESMPEVGKDKLTYTFKIRPGVKFHDDPAFPEGKGRELEAKDFVYSLLRLADTHTQSPGWWILEGRIEGLDAWREEMKSKMAADYDKPVSGIEVVDARTVKLKLVKPYPQLLNVLAMPYTGIVAREVVDKYGPEFLNKAVGTGPFILEEFRPSEIVTYRKNPNYWGGKYPSEGEAGDQERGLLADAGKALPLADRIEVRVMVESQPRWMNFMKGELEVIGVPKDNFKDAITPDVKLTQEFQQKGIGLEKTPALDFTYNSFNLASDIVPQFRDKRVRQAISLAIAAEQAREIELFYNGLAIPAETPIPPGVAGYVAEYKNPYKVANGIEKAKKLLADAGYKDGKGFPEIPYDIVSSTTSRQIAEFQASALKKVGLNLKILSNTWPEFQARTQRGQAHFWGIAWSADYPDAENFLQLFYGPNAQPGGMNRANYKNPRFDEIFNRARVMPDGPARTKLYEQLAKIVAEDVPVVFGVHRVNLNLTQPWLANYKYSEFPLNEAKYLDVRLDVKASNAK